MTATLPLYDVGTLVTLLVVWVALAVLVCALWSALACHCRRLGRRRHSPPRSHVRVLRGVYDWEDGEEW